MEIFFYIFSFFILLGSLGVICFANPVHSVLSLIFCFINASGIFILLKSEFIAMLVIIVYVGAIAVLFLFVVMMINYKAKVAKYSLQVFSVGAVIAFVLFTELMFILYLGFKKYTLPNAIIQIPKNMTNVKAIGSLLYTEYLLGFELAGLILLIAMVGSILLTHRIRKDVKKQDIYKQVFSSSKNRIDIVSIKSREGFDVK